MSALFLIPSARCCLWKHAVLATAHYVLEQLNLMFWTQTNVLFLQANKNRLFHFIVTDMLGWFERDSRPDEGRQATCLAPCWGWLGQAASKSCFLLASTLILFWHHVQTLMLFCKYDFADLLCRLSKDVDNFQCNKRAGWTGKVLGTH